MAFLKNKQIFIWLQAFRLKTLTAGFVPVLVGTALCVSMDQLHSYWLSLWILLGALCIQIATNLFNDAIDFKKGADQKGRLGPERVTQSGLLSQRQVLVMGCVFLGLSVVFGWPLVLRGGWPILGLGLFSLFLTYGYTGGPFPLAYQGLGDLFVILFFGLFEVLGTCYLQTLKLTWPMAMAGLQMGFLSTILIAINNLRDSQTDRKVHKKTLAVRFGDDWVRFEIAFLMLSIYLINFYYLLFWGNFYVLMSFGTLPLGIFILAQVYGLKDKSKLNKVLGLSALHQLLFALLFSIGLVLG